MAKRPTETRAQKKAGLKAIRNQLYKSSGVRSGGT